jgi:hypothetical protein
MKIFGVDFTSVPSAIKPITCMECRLDQNILSVEGFERITSFE